MLRPAAVIPLRAPPGDARQPTRPEPRLPQHRHTSAGGPERGIADERDRARQSPLPSGPAAAGSCRSARGPGGPGCNSRLRCRFGRVPMNRLATGGWSGVGALAAVLVSAALLAACTVGPHPAGNPTGPGGGAGQPTPAGGGGADALATVTSSPMRPIAHPTARPPGLRPTSPTDPVLPMLRPVAVPAACELNAPADGLQRSADAGHVPWRLFGPRAGYATA